MQELQEVVVRATKDIDLKSEELERSKYQTRLDIFEDPEDVKDLAENIRMIGLVNRPLVRKHPEKDGKYELIGGHRRVTAVVNILGWNSVPCRLVEGLDELEIFKLLLSENLQVNSLTHYEEGIAFSILRDDFGQKLDDIAKDVNRSLHIVEDRLELADDIEKARKIYDAPDFRQYILRLTQSQREQINKLWALGSDHLDYVRMGIKKVCEGVNGDDLALFVQACENSVRSGKRDINAAIARVAAEEKRKKRADVAQATYIWYDKIGKKIPKELKAEFDKGKTHIEWLVSENHEAKELKETLDKYSGGDVSCPKCHLKFQTSRASEKGKAVLLLKPREKKFEKKTIGIQLTLS